MGEALRRVLAESWSQGAVAALWRIDRTVGGWGAKTV